MNEQVRRNIALFPGAFRPPHAAHFTAVQDLVSRPGVTEVVIIISGRSRILPGTAKAMESDAVRGVWEIFLTGVPNVRVEVARQTAVDHAIAYLERAMAGDTLLFCLGEEDLRRGDPRFAGIAAAAGLAGVSAQVIAAPTGGMPIRATNLREALAQGVAGRASFDAAMPPHLTPEQRSAVWQICQAGLREVSDTVLDKVRSFLETWNPGAVGDLVCVKTGKLDPVIQARLADGQTIYVKYSGDTVESGSFGSLRQPKPAKRLAVESRAIRRLHGVTEVELPEVLHFDKETRMLVLSEVCPKGRSLHTELERGVFDGEIAEAAAVFLARCHATPSRPLWGSAEEDLAHWDRILALYARDGLVSEVALQNGYFHLDFTPRNIRVASGGRIGVIDLERCGSVGDPALDLGRLLGEFRLQATDSEGRDACERAVTRMLAAYRRESAGANWQRLFARATAFADAYLRLCRADFTSIRHRSD